LSKAGDKTTYIFLTGALFEIAGNEYKNNFYIPNHLENFPPPHLHGVVVNVLRAGAPLPSSIPITYQ
jgi:hypothetical protein